MFAFAVVDLRSRELFIARDPFGEKPMYVVNDERGVVFASELKAIVNTGFVSQELSTPGLADYLRFGYVPAPGSIFKNIWKLRASEMATLDLNLTVDMPQGSVQWQLTDYVAVETPADQWMAEFEERLSQSVRQKLEAMSLSARSCPAVWTPRPSFAIWLATPRGPGHLRSASPATRATRRPTLRRCRTATRRSTTLAN